MHDRWLGSGHREFGKGKNMLIKHNIPRDVDTISGHMKTFVSFMKRAITKKNTLLGTKLELTACYMDGDGASKHTQTP